MSVQILMADNSSTIQKVVRIALSPYNCEIHEAASLIEALDKSKRVNPDIVIFEAGLPGIKGTDELKKLRDDSQSQFLVLAGSFQTVDEKTLREAGYEHILRKPFESKEFVQTLETLLNKKLEPPTHVSAGPEPVPLAVGTHAPYPSHNREMPDELPITQGGRVDSSAQGLPEIDLDAQSDADLGETVERAAAPGMGSAPEVDLPPPPAPHVNQQMKGKRAFSPDATFSPPLSSGDENFDLDITSDQESNGSTKSGSFTNLQETKPRGQGGALKDVRLAATQPPSSPVAMGDDQMRLMMLDHLPGLVRDAVLEYCRKHFDDVAREIIGQELRRLSDERTRHLVD
jgi:CheY-like chemotaxis protein